MPMEVVIKCSKCDIPFILQDKYIVKKDALSCPNCDTPFPKDQFDNLKKAIEHLEKAKEPFERQHQKRFDFEIRESHNRNQNS